jgi:twinkle protein
VNQTASNKCFNDYNIQVNESHGGQQYVKCPQCSGQRRKKHSKCLSVNINEGVWNCHHCGWSGSLGQGQFGNQSHQVKPQYRVPKLPPSDDKSLIKAFNYLRGRGITNDVQVRNGLTTSLVWMPQIEAETSAIGFPYYREGGLINIKWRDSKKHFKMEGGCELILYKLDDIKKADTVIWCEGEIDALSVEVAGFPNCISIPNGAPSLKSKNYASHFDYLRSAESWIHGKEHILFTDSDEAGRKLEDELARRLGHDKCKRVRLPDGFKDANEYLVAKGAAALKEVIEAAHEYPVTGIYSVASVADAVMDAKERGLVRGALAGWPSINHLYSAMPEQWTLVTGIPNHGKSTFLDCMLLNIAESDGWRFGIFSPENQPIRRHVIGLIEKRANKKFSELNEHEIFDQMNWLHERFHWILPDFDDDWSLEGVLKLAKTLVYRQGIKGLVIDPWNELQHKIPQGFSETDYIAGAISKIRQFAHENSVHVWVVAHPTKLEKDKTTGEYPIPKPYNVSGSSHWANKADMAIAIHRPNFDKDYVLVCIQKVRFAEAGRVAQGMLIYDPNTCNYREKGQYD